MFAGKYLRLLQKKTAQILLVAATAGMLFYLYAERTAQQYVATAIIEYNSEDGNAPDGTEINTDEITSSEVISKACADIGNEISPDQVRSSITITPIVDEEEEALYESKLEHGEEYEIKNTRFKIVFANDLNKTKEFQRKVLNAVLQEYFLYYGKYHSSVNRTVNDIDDLNVRGNYDYIEMIDMIDDSLDSALETLRQRADGDSSFRSATTGYTFEDLYSELSDIRNTACPQVSARILKTGATKDKDVLLKEYEKKNADLLIENKTAEERIERLKTVMQAYSDMMKKSGNANLDADHVLQDISNDYGAKLIASDVDKTTSYDQLMEELIQAKTGYNKNKVEYDYNNYIIDTFSGIQDPCVSDEIQSEIDSLIEMINQWFAKADQTITDYNATLGASSLAMLTNVTVAEKIPTKMYSCIIVMAVLLMELVELAFALRIRELIVYTETEESDDENTESRKDAGTSESASVSANVNNPRPEVAGL